MTTATSAVGVSCDQSTTAAGPRSCWHSSTRSGARGGRAVEGVGPTLEALAEGRVRVLLLAPDAGRTAWFGVRRRRGLLVDLETLERVGASTKQARLADIAVRATLLTGAHIRILPVTGLPGTPREGIGALCRFR